MELEKQSISACWWIDLLNGSWTEMMVHVGKAIRDQVIKNLLLAHKQIAERGDVKELILLTKFILNISKKFDKDLFELDPEVDVI